MLDTDGAELVTGQWVITGDVHIVQGLGVLWCWPLWWRMGFFDGDELRLAVKALPEPLTEFEPLGCPCSAWDVSIVVR